MSRPTCCDFDTTIAAAEAAIATGRAAEVNTDDLEDALEGLRIERGEAHLFRWVRDWMGDPTIYRGTCDLSHWECVHCGCMPEDDKHAKAPERGYA